MDKTKTAAVAALESCVAAGALGYLHGRKGQMPTYGKIPLDGIVGGALALVGLFGKRVGLPESVTVHALGLGTGALTYLSGSIGGQFGQKARIKANELQGPPGAYLKEGDTSAPWRNSRTITGGMPTSGPAGAASYQHAWRK
jgi:hypothetical protein